MTDRQINTRFEQQILPELTVLLEDAFQELDDSDREEATQDAVCQALEVYRVLRLHTVSRDNDPRGKLVVILSKFASSRYLAGVRFAASRSTSHL